MKLWPVVLAGIFLAGCVTTPKQGKVKYEGYWATLGSDQDVFNIEVNKDGTALTNYFKNPAGAKGERGTWEAKDDGILLTYDSGWRDWILPKRSRGTFEKRGYEPGTTLEEIPSNIVAAFQLSGKGTEFVGIWKLGGQDDYLALISDGTAARTTDGGKTVTGSWKVNKTGLIVEWEDKSILNFARAGRGKYQTTETKDGKPQVLPAVRQTGRDK